MVGGWCGSVGCRFHVICGDSVELYPVDRVELWQQSHRHFAPTPPPIFHALHALTPRSGFSSVGANEVGASTGREVGSLPGGGS